MAFVGTLLLSTGMTHAQPSGMVPVALAHPAIEGVHATGAMMLAVTHAGGRLVAVGAGGTVLLSDDHGVSWRQAAMVPVSVLLTSVHFASPEEGWATGHLGAILHSSDGGEHWERQMDGVSAARLIADAASRLPDGPDKPKAKQAADQLVEDGPDKPFFDLEAREQGGGRRGYDLLAVGAYGLALKSGDGGKTWESAASDVPDPQGLHMYRMVASAPMAYVVGEQGLFLASADEARFKQVRTSYAGTFFGATLSRSGAILAYGLQGKLFRSVDRGGSWTEVRTGVPDTLTCGIVLRDGALLLGSQGGELLISKDDGATFRGIGRRSANAIAGMILDADAIVAVGPGGPSRIPVRVLAEGS